MSRDLAFISRRFDTVELPREKAYLYKYFKTKVQEAFLKYVYVFGEYSNFSDHTGISCTPRWLKKLHDRLVKLETLHREAKQGFDLETLAKIETGKYKL